MTAISAVLVVSAAAYQIDESPDRRFMQHGSYIAASKVNDPEALGGFGPSDRYPVPVKDPKLLSAGLKATLAASKDGLTLHLTNGGKEPAWIHAGDSNILAYLEAKDANGQWRPIEYKMWYTCGNSYHRLNLPPGHGWSFTIPLPKGDLKTQVRWRYYGRQDDAFVSNAVASSIPATRFELEPKLRGTSLVSTQWGNPTLMPKAMVEPPPPQG